MDKNDSGERLKNRSEKISRRMEMYNEMLNRRTKYTERIKTSYLSLLACLVFLAFGYKLDKTTDAFKAIIAACFCVCVYNIVKHVMSIKDGQKKKHNAILIGIQCLMILIISYIAFM